MVGADSQVAHDAQQHQRVRDQMEKELGHQVRQAEDRVLAAGRDGEQDDIGRNQNGPEDGDAHRRAHEARRLAGAELREGGARGVKRTTLKP